MAELGLERRLLIIAGPSLLKGNLPSSQEDSDSWRLASVPRLNQPFPRWVPGEAQAEVAAWGIFLALSPADGSGYAITRALVPSRPGPVLRAQGSGICCQQQCFFLLDLESPWTTCPELRTTGVSWTLLALTLQPGPRMRPSDLAFQAQAVCPCPILLLSPLASELLLRLCSPPDTPSSANSSSIHGSDRTPAPLLMTTLLGAPAALYRALWMARITFQNPHRPLSALY